MQRPELERYLADLLQVDRFRDYCPNGLQVEGRASVARVVTGVTASQALLDAAAAADADTVIVHHGYFWRGEDGRITGIRKSRLALLLGRDINLFAYHLPLDAHPDLGNNAQLARLMDWSVSGRFADQDVGFIGEPSQPTDAASVAELLGQRLGRAPMLVGNPARRVRRIAWCTGAAQDRFEQAIAMGADVFVSGEISEQTVHLAREAGIPYVAAGHHATERYGVRALADHLAQRFGMQCTFVDVDNPV